MDNSTGSLELRKNVAPEGSAGSEDYLNPEAADKIRKLLEKPLYDFDEKNRWTIQDAIEGTQIFGATGSGKSSGSGRALATSLIHHHIGGVVLAAKDDELNQWLRYFRQAGVEDPIREKRLRVIEPGGKHRFDPLAYEFNLDPEGGTRRLTNLFMTALGSGEGRVASDPYWDDALRELLGHAIDLVYYSHMSLGDAGCLESRQRPPALEEIADVIKSSAHSRTEVHSRRWRESDEACPRLLRRLDSFYEQLSPEQRGTSRAADIRDTFGYWTRVFPSLADRTRSVILTSFTGKANDLLRHPLRDLFCSGDSIYKQTRNPSVSPEVTYEEGAIVLLNLPVKQYGEVGEFAQKLYKTVWQHTTESPRRKVTPGTMPTFLWSDEAQHFVTREDVLFQATARSKRAATVYLTQNISNYYARLGGSQSSSTDALLGSLQMKIFHANGDPATNEWAERLFGQRDTPDQQSNHNLGRDGYTAGGTTSTRTKPDRPARMFTKLRRGTGQAKSTQAIVFHAGKEWSNKSNSINADF